MIGYRYILFFWVIICLICTNNSFANKQEGVQINIVDRGARGDGTFDNWEIIQRAVDEVINKGGGTVFFPKGKFAIYGKSIAIWGSNVKLVGEDPNTTSVVKKGPVGYFGEAIDICGKIYGYQYYGEFGSGDYKIIRIYRGDTQAANNVTIQNLKIGTEIAIGEKKRQVANNLGIINSRNILIKNCILENAPQSNLAIVNDTEQFSNGKINVEDCVFRLSEQHNVRVISYNQGQKMGNYVTFNRCKFTTMMGKVNLQKELKEYDVHLWYRGAVSSGKSFVSLNKCIFDETGIIMVSGNTNGFSIRNSEVASSLNIVNSSGLEKKPKIEIFNTVFKLQGAANKASNYGMKLNNRSSLKNGFKKMSFGQIYPGNLKVDE